MLLLFLSTTLSLSCSTFPTPKGFTPTPINPEIQLSPGSQRNVPSHIIQTELGAPFGKSWQVTLDTLKQSGHSIFEVIKERGEIRTLDKQFEGANYPWRESYSIHMATTRDNRTLIKVKRTVKVYRRLFLVGPNVWMIRPSNGQREKMLIERVEQRLRAGIGTDEN